MFIKKLKDCAEFVAGDACVLREILHPDKADLKLRYSLAFARVFPGKTTKLHKLKTSEVYYILEGKGVMRINEERSKVSSGDTVYIPPKSQQSITNSGRTVLKFLCIVDPAWRITDEEMVVSIYG